MKVSQLSVGDQIMLCATMGKFVVGQTVVVVVIQRLADGLYRVTLAAGDVSDNFTLDADEEV